VVSLLLLLLPLLLVTTSAQKRVGLDLKVSSGEGPQVPSMGAVESLAVHLDPNGLEVRAALRRADVTAASGETEERLVRVPHGADGPDLAQLQATLRELKRLDPTRVRISLLPTDEVAAGTLVAVLDAVRGDRVGPLFPTPLLGAAP
jgi:hypothetical protein